MKRTLFPLLSIVLVTGSLSLAADDPFAGRFTVAGVNPDGEGRYTGSLTIKRNDEVYDVSWTIGNGQTLSGVGVVVDGKLSVGYWASDKSWTGVVVYRARPDGSLSGIWAGMGNGRTGTENAVRN
jgi:hypothetical protein